MRRCRYLGYPFLSSCSPPRRVRDRRRRRSLIGTAIKLGLTLTDVTSSILIQAIAEWETVDGIVNECEARRTEYWRSQMWRTTSVSGEVGIAARPGSTGEAIAKLKELRSALTALCLHGDRVSQVPTANTIDDCRAVKKGKPTGGDGLLDHTSSRLKGHLVAAYIRFRDESGAPSLFFHQRNPI